MAQIELNTTQLILEQLRCSICEGYLSSPPIYVQSDGKQVCSQCKTSKSNNLAYRVPILETILSNARFPCVFKQYGCSELVLFNKATEHEIKCEYRPILCVSLPNTNCLWEGSLIQIPNHFTKEHSDLIKQNAEFKLQVYKNQHGILMVKKNNCAFIIRYFYEAETSNLEYDIRYFTPNAEEDFCKIKLSNNSDQDYSVYVKGCKCVLYNDNFFTVDHVSKLDIKKYFDILNKPTSIIIGFKLPNCGYKNDLTRNVTINYELLALNKCSKCKYFLIPPVYVYNNNNICSNCSYSSENCVLSNDNELQCLLREQNYPCRWRGCGFIAKSPTILEHEIECRNRIYRCVKSSCKTTFDRSKLIEHFQEHNYNYFEDKLTYTMCFEKPTNGNDEYLSMDNENNYEGTVINKNYAFTVLENEFVLITHQTCFDRSSNNHILALKTSSVNPKQFTAKVHFEHDHCKCVSDDFCFNRNALLINFSLLPSCFKKEDELTATLCIK